jgi:2-polyprenyl-6-methoxyphenol hydroxylase-like FAD-dependent oxidoreductase
VVTDGDDVATTAGAGEVGTAAILFGADGAEESTREVIGANFSAATMLGDVGLVNDEVTTVTSRSSRSMEGVTTEAAG